MNQARVGALLSCAVLLAGCATGVPRNSAGQVTAPASMNPYQLQLGDCTGPLKDGDVGSLQVLPCDSAHHFEAFATTDLDAAAHPGDSEVTKKANTYCTAQFKTFVGIAADDSAYKMLYLYPTEESWATGDRAIMCLAGSDAGKITGSLRGVKK
ncbi:MAG: septum formation family protein [Micropruina sp.]|nr:septum formation family protein [Micropruina sp.]